MEKQPLLVAYGMGVDSTAMLVGMHKRGIRPDAILFADTGSEKPETYHYIDIIQSWLERVGFPQLTIVRYVPKRFKHAPYATLEGNCIANSTLPSLAFGRKSCSLKWKVAPQDKWTENWAPAQSAWADGLRVTKAIGYDASPADTRRCTYASAKYGEDEKYQYWYPLQDWGWTRDRCMREIASAGLPVPVKSACFFCPASKPHEIAAIVDDHPELADRIVAMEAKAAPNLKKIEGLWRKGVKGVRGGTPKPGSMTTYIEHYRSTGKVRYELPVIDESTKLETTTTTSRTASETAAVLKFRNRSSSDVRAARSRARSRRAAKAVA